MHTATIDLKKDIEKRVRTMKELNAEVKENMLKVRHMRAQMEKMGKDMSYKMKIYSVNISWRKLTNT